MSGNKSRTSDSLNLQPRVDGKWELLGYTYRIPVKYSGFVFYTGDSSQ